MAYDKLFEPAHIGNLKNQEQIGHVTNEHTFFNRRTPCPWSKIFRVL